MKFHMEIITDLPKSKRASGDLDVIQLIENPDGSKRLSIRFDQLLQKSPERKLGYEELYTNLLTILQERTNFVQLSNQADYLLAISKFLQAAYFGSGKVDAHSDNVIRKLGNELKILSFPETEYVNMKGRVEEDDRSSDEGSQNLHSIKPTDPSPMGHYSTEKELSNLGEPNVETPYANIAKNDAENREQNSPKISDKSFPSMENELYKTESVPDEDEGGVLEHLERVLEKQNVDHHSQNTDGVKDENTEHSTTHLDPLKTQPVQSNGTKFDKSEL